jgi:cytochrome c
MCLLKEIRMKKVVMLAAALLAVAGPAAASQQLAQKNSCMSCHQIDKKVVGPAFKDVAKKYKGDAGAQEHLMNVVKKGGKGVWGSVPMPPHPQVKDEDAKAILTWVLSL